MKIDHLGIATANIENALSFWRDVFGLEASGSEEVPDQGVRVAMLPIGETRIELLEPLHENSPVGRFLEKRGPGFHHLAIGVADIQAHLGKLREKGIRLIDEVPRVGAGGCLIAFVHPSATGGVLLELVERR
jgi:methylmalonyl-CoA/ethylmalonyl-CoA epimerase